MRRNISANGATTARSSQAASRAGAVPPGSRSGGAMPPGSGVNHTVTMPTSISAAISA